MFRRIAYLLILSCCICFAFTIKTKQAARNGFAVVELFTSEGCSSCPPADALIAKLERENENKPIYILAYHVDYWDRLGWKDTFSDHRYAQRQNQYASWLNLKGVYTPQIVVNGTHEFVGSQEKTLRNAIASSLTETTNGKLDLSILENTTSKFILTYQSDQPTLASNLVVALIKPNATNKIDRGENGGKTLSHVQIVRHFDTFKLGANERGVVNFSPINKNWQGDAELIAFLQNTKTGKITAATKIKIMPPHS